MFRWRLCRFEDFVRCSKGRMQRLRRGKSQGKAGKVVWLEGSTYDDYVLEGTVDGYTCEKGSRHGSKEQKIGYNSAGCDPSRQIPTSGLLSRSHRVYDPVCHSAEWDGISK